MAKQKKSSRPLKANEWRVIHDFALSLERGRFTEYAEILTNTKRLLWKSFVAGLGRGFGAIVGATLVVALLVILLGWLGDSLPGEAGDFFTDTKETIKKPVKQ